MPRIGLTPARLAQEAAELADTEGFDTLTLAGLAKRLGIQVPSLYRHVDGLAGVRRQVALLGVQGMTKALSSATVGLSRREALVAACHAYRLFAATYPGRYAAIQRPADPENPAERELAEHGQALTELVLSVLRAYHFTEDYAVHAARILRSCLHGFVTLEQLGGFQLQVSVEESFELLIDALDAGLSTLAGRQP